MALIALARSALLIAEDPTYPGRRVLAQIKSSLGPAAPMLGFCPVEQAGGLRIDWFGQVDYGLDQLVHAGRYGDGPAVLDAAYFIYSLLAQGPVLAKQAKQLCKGNIADRTAERAKRLLGVKSVRLGFGPGSKVIWQLPEKNELLERLRSRDLDELCDKLVSEDVTSLPPRTTAEKPLSAPELLEEDDDEYDPADWWMGPANEQDDADDDA